MSLPPIPDWAGHPPFPSLWLCLSWLAWGATVVAALITGGSFFGGVLLGVVTTFAAATTLRAYDEKKQEWERQTRERLGLRAED